MASEKTTAIVLRVTEFSETSCIALVLTRDFGKQTLIAKGARRPKSPFEAALDVLSICRIVFLPKPPNSQGSAMGILTEAKLERRFRNSRREMNQLYAAFYVIELLKCLMEEGDPHPELFDLAVATIQEIDGSRYPQADFVRPFIDFEKKQNFFELNRCLLRFETGLLKNLGHFPMLSRCVGCGKEKKTTNDAGFALNAGGIICSSCRNLQTNVMQVESGTIAALEQLGNEFDEEVQKKSLCEADFSEDRGSEKTLHPNVHSKNCDFLSEPREDYSIGSEGETAVDRTTTVALRRLMNRYMTAVLGFEPRLSPFLKNLGVHQAEANSAERSSELA